MTATLATFKVAELRLDVSIAIDGTEDGVPYSTADIKLMDGVPLELGKALIIDGLKTLLARVRADEYSEVVEYDIDGGSEE